MTGSTLHTPFVFSYMRRGASNMKKVSTTSNNETTVPSSSTDDKTTTSTTVAATQLTTDATATTQQQQVPVPAQQHHHHNHPAVYETSIRTIRQVHTIESFWETYDYLKRPNDLPPNIDYHFFRCVTDPNNGTVTPIKPTWEDPNNTNGGKWIIRLPKGLASRYWEEIIFALIGGQFSSYNIIENEICGAVLSIRYSEDIIGIWNRNAHLNPNEIEKIRIAIQKILQLPNNAYMEYKPHETSLQDRTTSSSSATGTGKSTTTATTGAVGTAATTTTNSNTGPAQSRTSSSTSGPSSSGGSSSRRSGSWTERDKTNVHIGSNSTNIKPSARGSWRN